MALQFRSQPDHGSCQQNCTGEMRTASPGWRNSTTYACSPYVAQSNAMHRVGSLTKGCLIFARGTVADLVRGELKRHTDSGVYVLRIFIGRIMILLIDVMQAVLSMIRIIAFGGQALLLVMIMYASSSIWGIRVSAVVKKPASHLESHNHRS